MLRSSSSWPVSQPLPAPALAPTDAQWNSPDINFQILIRIFQFSLARRFAAVRGGWFQRLSRGGGLLQFLLFFFSYATAVITGVMPSLWTASQDNQQTCLYVQHHYDHHITIITEADCPNGRNQRADHITKGPEIPGFAELKKFG
jgi:hypothetical protein